MDKFRIEQEFCTLEISRFDDGTVQFSTAPDHQGENAQLSQENALKIANKLIEWSKFVDNEK